jgi:hypothetical protein
MKPVVISPKWHVGIWRRVREALAIRSGRKVCVMQKDQRLENRSVLRIREARGFLKAIKTDVPREKNRL